MKFVIKCYVATLNLVEKREMKICYIKDKYLRNTYNLVINTVELIPHTETCYIKHEAFAWYIFLTINVKFLHDIFSFFLNTYYSIRQIRIFFLYI